MKHLNNTILFKAIIRLIIFVQFFTFAYGQVMITNVEDCCHNKVIVEKPMSCCSSTENTTSISDDNCNDYFNLINLKQNCGCDHQFVDLNTILLKIKTDKPSFNTDFVHLLIEKINCNEKNIRFNFYIDSKPFLLISRDICILKSSFLI